jgi:hypothetical protein
MISFCSADHPRLLGAIFGGDRPTHEIRALHRAPPLEMYRQRMNGRVVRVLGRVGTFGFGEASVRKLRRRFAEASPKHGKLFR